MINTWTKFYFDFEVTQFNRYLDIDEGAGNIAVDVTQGKYSVTDGIFQVESDLTDQATQAYTISFDRTTRLVTISAVDPFDLMVATGPSNDTSIFPLLGFTGADRTGSNSYTGNLPCSKQYSVQFKLQDFIHPDHYRKAVDSTVRKAANGRVEVVQFGQEQLIQANMKFITDKPQDGRVIRNNPAGVAAVVEFLGWGIRKAPFEFIADELNPGTYWKVILEKTTEGTNGVDYKLKELYDRGAPGYFETGVMLFRIVE